MVFRKCRSRSERRAVGRLLAERGCPLGERGVAGADLFGLWDLTAPAGEALAGAAAAGPVGDGGGCGCGASWWRPVSGTQGLEGRLLSEVADSLRAQGAARLVARPAGGAGPTPGLLRSAGFVVDDLNWADVPSLSLLAFLAAELKDARLVVVGTYRDVEVVAGRPLADTLGALAREPVVERISLGGLDRDGAAALIGRAIGAKPAEPLVEAVAERCGGNPFFITELLRLLQSERRLAGPAAAAAARRDIPAGVRDVLRARLARLPAQTSTFLMVAAVAGRGFDLDLVEAVTGLDDEAALDAAEAALLAGLVLEDDRAAGRYRFAHALVRETI